MDEYIKILTENYSCEKNTFIYMLHERSIFDSDLYWKYYNAIFKISEFYLNKPLDNKIAKMIFDTYSYFLKSVIYNLSTDDLYKIKNYPKDISLYIERLNDRISVMYFGKKQFDEEIYNVELKNPFYKRESK